MILCFRVLHSGVFHPLSRSLSRMPPLPSLESLARVNTALAQEQRRANNPRRTLQVLLESLRSESLSVRYTVLVSGVHTETTKPLHGDDFENIVHISF